MTSSSVPACSSIPVAIPSTRDSRNRCRPKTALRMPWKAFLSVTSLRHGADHVTGMTSPNHASAEDVEVSELPLPLSGHPLFRIPPEVPGVLHGVDVFWGIRGSSNGAGPQHREFLGLAHCQVVSWLPSRRQPQRVHHRPLFVGSSVERSS